MVAPRDVFFRFSNFDSEVEIRVQIGRIRTLSTGKTVWSVKLEPFNLETSNLARSFLSRVCIISEDCVRKFSTDPELWSGYRFLSTAEDIASCVKPVILV